tara:strand:+ start:1540 stop:2217 length:678 start_codon:yes stop_codon:yes gene_type:complete
MTYRFSLWRDKLLLLSLLALFNAGSSHIRVLLRSLLEGADFRWSYYVGVRNGERPAIASGQGMFGHTDTILIGSLVLLWMLWAVSRRPDRFMVTALAGWTTLQLGSALWLAAQLGDDLRISKETIGLINVSFAWVIVPPLIISWLLSMALLVRTLLRRSEPAAAASWTPVNTVSLAVAAGGLALSGVALNFGVQHGAGDLLGIGLIYASLFALMLGLAPWERKPV